MRETTIYALIDPRTKRPYYVGKAVDTKRRFTQHLSFARRYPMGPVQFRTREILESGLRPEFRVLETFVDREIWWIWQLSKDNELVNVVWSEETVE